MIKEFLQKPIIPKKSWQVIDPYYYVRIDSLARDDILLENLINWEKDLQYDIKNSYYADFIGLKKNIKQEYLTLTKNVDLPLYNLFLFELFIMRSPQVPKNSKGNLTFTASQTTSEGVTNDIMIEKIHMHDNYSQDYDVIIRCPILRLDPTLPVTFTIQVPKFGYVQFLKIIPIIRFEGGTNRTLPSDSRLDIQNISFSKNGVNEVDKGQIKIGFKEDYYNVNNPYSTLYFDAFDHVTIAIGDSMNNVKPVFGGYISGWSLNDEFTELTLDIIDRLYDLSRTSVWKNYGIGPVEEENKKKPYTQLPTVEQTIDYLIRTCYALDIVVFNDIYIFKENFGDQNSVNSLIATGWNIDWISDMGNAAPSVKLTPQNITNLNEVRIFKDEEYLWDAAIYNYFNFDYFLTEKPEPPSFYIEIDMQKTKDSNPKTYFINFTGNTNITNKEQILGKLTPKVSGEWEHFTVNLKELFNNTNKAASKNYYIRQIRFVATANNMNNSSVYVDNLTAYKYTAASPRFNRTELKKVLEEVQEICKLSNYVAYIKPGMERRDDKLVVLKSSNSTLDISVIENKNLLDVSSLEYKPLDWGLCNYAERTYKSKVPKPVKSNKSKAKKTKKSKTTKKKKIQTITIKKSESSGETDSYIWYGPLTSIEQTGDVETKEDAIVLADNYVEEHAFQNIAFTVKVLGSALLDPAHLINVSIPSKQIFGAYEIKALNYELNPVTSNYTTQITFGQLYRPYMHFVRNSMKSRGTLRNIYNESIYNNYGFKESGANNGLVR